jgi:hypothetical protein
MPLRLKHGHILGEGCPPQILVNRCQGSALAHGELRYAASCAVSRCLRQIDCVTVNTVAGVVCGSTSTGKRFSSSMKACVSSGVSRLRFSPIKSAFRTSYRQDTPYGGESGIRTHVRVSPKHAFQACAFNHSAISPGFSADRSAARFQFSMRFRGERLLR